MAFKPIEILINAKDNASGVFTSLQGKIAAVGAAIATYFGVRAFAGVVEGAADFEAGMSRVKAATGATAQEMQLLKKAAEDAGANTKYTSTEAAAALENLAKAGLTATDAIATLPAVLNLAQAGDIELATASEFVTKAVMGMGLAFSDAGRVADVLALGANATNTSVTGLAQALSYAAPVANTLGLSLESTVAIIGKFADAGIDAGRAGTALNSIMSQFANPASQFRNELAAAGITTGNFEDALHQLAKAGPAGSKAINAVGLEAGPALRALLNQGMGALDELTAKLKSAEGAAAATAKVMEDNLKGSMTGLASAWDTVKNVLGTPVLPVLKDGVDQLAGAFRSAVADGTVQKFGESIATAFQAGIKWVREFIGQVDFTQVAADLRAFADRAGEAFQRLGEHATTAGGVAKVAYGVMSGGANAVLAGIYGLGIAFAESAKFIVKAAAGLSESLSKIAIGDAKQRLINEAAQMREAFIGLTGVSEEFGEKAKAALAASAEGAQLARDGFTGLTQASGVAKTATEEWAETVAAATREFQKTIQATDAAAAAVQKKAASDQAAKQSAEEHRTAIAGLRAEYRDLVANGDLQAATLKLQELNKELAATPAASKDAAKAAADAAAQIEAAFGRLGVVSAAVLKDTATNAARDYELIKNAGTSTAEDIAAAFKVAAEKAIAANKGIAPSWVEADAAARGYEIAVDATGKSTLKIADSMVKGWDGVANAARGAGRAASESAAANAKAIDEINAKYGQSQADRDGKYGPVGKTPSRVGNSRDTTFVNVLQSDVNQAIAKRYGDGAVGNQTAEAAYAARLQLESYQRNYGNSRSVQSMEQQRNYAAELARLEKELETERLKTNGQAPGTPGQTVVNLSYNGAGLGSVSTDAAGRSALEQFMRALSNDRSTAR